MYIFLCLSYLNCSKWEVINWKLELSQLSFIFNFKWKTSIFFLCLSVVEENCSSENHQLSYKKPFIGSSSSEGESYYHPSSYPPPPPGLSNNPALGLTDSPYSSDMGQRQACMFAGSESRMDELSCASWSYPCPIPTAMTPMEPYPPYTPHPPYSSSPQGSRLSAIAHQTSPPLGEHITNDPYQRQNSAPPSQSSQNIHSRQLGSPLREYPRYTPNLSPPLYHTLETHTHIRCGVPEWSAAS